MLTRVKKDWRESVKRANFEHVCAAVTATGLNDQHHLRVERSWYLAGLWSRIKVSLKTQTP